MLKIIISGCNGHMGRVVEELCNADSQVEVVAGFDILGSNDRNFPIFTSPAQFTGDADAVIDFSSPAALDGLLEFAKATKTPLVLATTGYSPEQIAKIGAAALEVPIFRSANMSLGINVLIELVKKAASVLGDSYDIEIVERHHRRKVDAPSGTALMLFNAVKEVRPAAEANCGRAGEGKRTKDEIGISSLRMGNVVGIHEVHICTGTQTLTLKHEATTRAMLADGAVDAARFMVGKGKGLYNMEDILG